MSSIGEFIAWAGLWFLEGKPTYNCRFHSTDWWHEVGCPHKDWTKEELQDALDKAKRALELRIKDPL